MRTIISALHRFHVHPVVRRIAKRGEHVFNVALVGATAHHEWGNLVGKTALPLLVACIITLFLQDE